MSSDGLAGCSTLGNNDRIVKVARSLTPDEIGRALDGAATKKEISIIKVYSTLRRGQVTAIEGHFSPLSIYCQCNSISCRGSAVLDIDIIERDEF